MTKFNLYLTPLLALVCQNVAPMGSPESLSSEAAPKLSEDVPGKYLFSADSIQTAFKKCGIDDTRKSANFLVGRTHPENVLTVTLYLSHDAKEEAPLGRRLHAREMALDAMPCVMDELLSPVDSDSMKARLAKMRRAEALDVALACPVATDVARTREELIDALETEEIRADKRAAVFQTRAYKEDKAFCECNGAETAYEPGHPQCEAILSEEAADSYRCLKRMALRDSAYDYTHNSPRHCVERFRRRFGSDYHMEKAESGVWRQFDRREREMSAKLTADKR